MKRIALSGLLVALSATLAHSAEFDFSAITANDPSGNAQAAAEAQLKLIVTETPAGQVLFTFQNNGPEAMFIADIYFDDNAGVLDSLVGIDNSDPGVNFTTTGAPPNLPSGNTVGFASDYDVHASNPSATHGVNPGESVGVLFDLAPGMSLNDVVMAIGNGSLLVGVHVQGFAGGFSESLIATPEPATVALALVALAIGGVFAYRRRRELALVGAR